MNLNQPPSDPDNCPIEDGDERCETWAIDDNGDQIPGTGSYWEGPERCEEEWLFGDTCIREVGHDGPCFCYDDHGSYCHWNHKDGELSGSIPAGHDEYPRPEDMHCKSAVGLGSWKEIEEGC